MGLVADGVEADPVYLRNRDCAFEALSSLITRALDADKRLLLAFDFPFGYPSGFAAAVTGASDPLALWAHIDAHLTDTPKANTRFELAAALNRRLPGVGPFWFNALKTDIPDLPRKGGTREGHGMAERRAVEQKAMGTFTCWQMGGAGAVGGQAMTGIKTLQRLRQTFPGSIAVWPFQTLNRPIAFVETWPSLIDPVVRAADDAIRDRAQVRLMARALSRLPAERLAAMLAVDAPEEGWILGVGFEAELMRHL